MQWKTFENIGSRKNQKGVLTVIPKKKNHFWFSKDPFSKWFLKDPLFP